MKNIKKLCLTALFTAIVCLVTRFIQIPIPLGYFNIGNCVIITFCCLIECPYGIIIGSVGAALADLISFPEWTITTLIIKALMTGLFYLIVSVPHKKKYLFNIIAGTVSMLIPVPGYVLAGSIIYGSFATGLTQTPGLILEYVANVVLFAVLLLAVDKSGIRKLLRTE